VNWQHVIESALGTAAAMTLWVGGRRAGAFLFERVVLRVLQARQLQRRLK
jgi:hypothetical protein